MSGIENEVVPRILLKGIPRNLKLSDIFIELRKFGTLTFIGLGTDNAVVEFKDRIALGKVLSRQPLRLKGKNVCVTHEPDWQKIAGLVKKRETFALDLDLKSILQSEEAFYTKVDYLIGVADRLSIAFDDNPEDQDKSSCRHPVCYVLERALSQEFSSIRVYPFGSRVTGTALETSDFDLFVDCDNRFYYGSNNDAEEQAEYLDTVKRLLTKSWSEFTHVVAVPKARVPIVKFLHCPSDTRCDASFNNGLGCRNARLLKFITSLDDRIRPLLLLLKHWVYNFDLISASKTNNRPELTSHALAMMTFTYLQTTKPPILPPVKYMKQSANYSLVVGGWETAFCSVSKQFQITASSDKRTVRELFLGFIRQLQSVDWVRLAASPLEGAHIQRNLLAHNILATNLPMVVLDPLNLARNLTGNVSDVTLCRLLAACALTEEEMAVD